MKDLLTYQFCSNFKKFHSFTNVSFPMNKFLFKIILWKNWKISHFDIYFTFCLWDVKFYYRIYDATGLPTAVCRCSSSFSSIFSPWYSLLFHSLSLSRSSSFFIVSSLPVEFPFATIFILMFSILSVGIRREKALGTRSWARDETPLRVSSLISWNRRYSSFNQLIIDGK